ncbi:Transposase IS4 [Popillia japonica]|uniref:Transposase IS4 n=1 Tax=Popillia japonica TaxID=7064 RepID=A0AAW1HWF5_POPJA
MARSGYHYRVTDDGISFMKWRDRKIVLFASNFHVPDHVRTVERKNKDGTLEAIQCPIIVKDYNSFMGYVDKAGHLKSIGIAPHVMSVFT